MISVATASHLIRTARRSRRLTQSRLAETASIDQSSVSRLERGRGAEFNTVDRLLAATGHRLYLAPTRRDDAAAAAAHIRENLRGHDPDRALRVLLQLNDDLVAEHGLTRGVLGLAEPVTTRDKVWDAAVAALVAWRLGEEGLPVPDWTEAPSRSLLKPAVLRIDPSDPVPPLSEVPSEFARRGVLAWRDTFTSI